MFNFLNKIKNQKGQGTLEMILMMAVVIILYMVVSRELLEKQEFADKIVSPLQNQYPKVYQNGLPNARGIDDPEGPFMHPRSYETGNFRVFIHNAEIR